MTATELWLGAAAIVFGIAGVLHLAGSARPIPLGTVGHALVAWALAGVCVALAVSVL